MFRLVSKIVTLIILLASLVSCSNLDPTFWKNNGATISIGITPYPIYGNFYRTSTDFSSADFVIGLLFIPFAGGAPSSTTKYDSMNKELNELLNRIGSSGLLSVKTFIADEFEKRGMKVLPIDENNLSSYEHSEIKNYREDVLKAYRKQTNADYLMLIVIRDWGIRMFDFPLITTFYTIFLSMNVKLIDLHNGEIIWKFNRPSATGREFSIRIIGELTQSPDYPNLTEAMRELIRKMNNELYKSFFE